MKETSKKSPSLFLYFINMLINDMIFLLDEVLEKVKKMHTTEQQMANSEEWQALPQERRSELEQVRLKSANFRSYNKQQITEATEQPTFSKQTQLILTP